MEGIASKLMRCTPDIIKTVENEVEQQRLRGLEGNPGGGQGGIGGMFAPNRHSLEGRVSPFKTAVRSIGRMSDLFHSHHRAAEHGALGEGGPTASHEGQGRARHDVSDPGEHESGFRRRLGSPRSTSHQHGVQAEAMQEQGQSLLAQE